MERDALRKILAFLHDFVQDVSEPHHIVIVEKRINGLLELDQLLLIRRQPLGSNLEDLKSSSLECEITLGYSNANGALTHPASSHGDNVVVAVVESRIIQDLLEVSQELLPQLVLVLGNVLLDLHQVHRLLHHIIVIFHLNGFTSA